MSSPTNYQYRMPQGLDHLTISIRIYDAFNLRPSNVDWFQGLSSADGELHVHSARELTHEEKGKLDALMAELGSRGGRPRTGDETVFIVEDVFDAWERIEGEVGARIRWIFPNVPDHTKIEVWFDRRLSPAEKRRVIDAYSKLISEKA